MRALALLAGVLALHSSVDGQASEGGPRGDVIAVKAGRVITVSGEEIKDGVILIEDGKITKVGAGLEIPAGAQIIDASAQVVMPGIVDGSTDLGVEGSSNEETDEIVPHVRILDSLNLRQPALQRALQGGVTTAYVGPGNRSVIGGLGSVVKTSGRSLQEAVVREDVALKAAMGSGPSWGNFPPRGMPPTSFYARRPTTRMGVVWEFRKAFFEARAYKEEAPARKDPAREVLVKALERKVPVRVAASRAGDIETAVRLADEFGLAISIEEAQEAYRHAELLAKKRVAVFLRPTYQTSTLYGAEGSEVRFTTFTALLAAGVPTALLAQTGVEGEGALAMAAFAVKYGATRAQALRAITLTPAELLGVAERVGSLEAGKDADLLFLSGDPLDVTSRIERVMVGGKVAAGRKIVEH